MWGRAMLACLASVLLASCDASPPRAKTVQSVNPLVLPGPVAGAEPVQPAGPNGQVVFTASSGRVKPGVTYRFLLYTHCGLNKPTGPDFDASFWSSVDDGGSGNPPPGLGNPDDQGTMTLLSTDLAEYRSLSGVSVRFSRQGTTRTGWPCA